jgi:hypothetical protein
MILKCLFAVALISACAVAQQSAAPQQETPKTNPRPAPAPNTDSRRFVFVLDELDHGRKLNSRSFEVLCREGQDSALKSGSRLPLYSGPTSFQYYDVGLNVRAHYNLRADNRLDTRIEFDMTNVAGETSKPSDTREQPVIRQNRSEISATITPEAPTLLDSIEDLSSGHTYQLTVTAKAR